MSQTQQLSPAESLERQQSTKDEPKKNSRRPPNTAFRQQRLKAWQPILTPKTVIPLLLAVGAIFGPLGGLLLYASAKVQELSIDYSECINAKPPGASEPIREDRYNAYFKSNLQDFYSNPPHYITNNITVDVPGADPYATNMCTVQFQIPEDINPPVYLYYRLTNFYQNHRRYVKSYDQDQLNGKNVKYADLSLCDPLRSPSPTNQTLYYPCGLIANSLFNDTFSPPVLLNSIASSAANETYNMTNVGIAWSSDADLYGTQPGNDLSQILPPPNWMKRFPNGYTTENPPPNFKTDEAFQNWMRTAGLPTFSKLALRNDNEVMKRGSYAINITDNYPTALWGGEKQLLISTRTVIGGKNSFLGIAYVVVAGVCVLLGTVFAITNLIKPRKLGDHSYLSWNQDKPATRRQ